MKTLLPFLPLLVFAVVIPLVILGAVVARRKTEDNLRKLAGQLGLDFQPAPGWLKRPRVAGALRGKAVEVFGYSTGSGKSQTQWAALSVRPARAGALTFTLQKQGLGTKLSELFGAHEITVGDPAFDDVWFVQTNQPEFFGAALIPELREKLMAARRAGARGKFELKDGLVKYAEQGTFADAKRTERFGALADVLGDLADVAEVAAAVDRRT